MGKMCSAVYTYIASIYFILYTHVHAAIADI